MNSKKLSEQQKLSIFIAAGLPVMALLTLLTDDPWKYFSILFWVFAPLLAIWGVLVLIAKFTSKPNRVEDTVSTE